MKLFARNSKAQGVTSYRDTMSFIQECIIDKYNVTNGHGGLPILNINRFFYNVKEILIDAGCKCEKMVVDPFSSFDSKFIHITFEDIDNHIFAHYCFGVDKDNHCFFLKTYDIYNKEMFSELCHKYLLNEMIFVPKEINGFSVNKVMKVDLIHKKKGDTSIVSLEGTLPSIFEQYINKNDFLRYINDESYSFKDEKIKETFNRYVENYNGNIFLDLAVKRGCLID